MSGYDRHGLTRRAKRWLDQPRNRPRGKPNPNENPFGIDYFSPSCTPTELVRFYTPYQRREWWRWNALWMLRARRRKRDQPEEIRHLMRMLAT
jgi:hypothetical protein